MKTLLQWLDAISVLECDEMNFALSHIPDNDINKIQHPPGWYGVCNDAGIIAYFEDSTDAFRFRLDYINRKLNP